MSKKIAGPVDFSGQESRDKAGGETPESEARDREMTVNYSKKPTIDDPSQKKAASVIYESDDVRLHAARSEVGGDYSGVGVP